MLNQSNKYRESNSYVLFDQLFSNFQIKNTKYEWMTSIPLMIRKHFGQVLDDVRKKAKEELYRVLDVVLLKQESPVSSPQKHEARFYSKINEMLLNHSEKDASELVRDSLLFEEDVVMKCTELPLLRPAINESMFRESVFASQEMPKHQTIMKEAIFIENLSQKDQEDISFGVELYNRFANILEGLMTSVSFCSLLLRHFEESMKEKKARKKLKTKQIERSSSIFQDEGKGETARQRQKYNQTLLLEEVNDFVELYTAFVWDFYELDQLKRIKFGTLISYENINSLIMNTVWLRVSWIGQRGCEYEEELLRLFILKHVDPSDLAKVKPEVVEICANMSLNPMKYLKEVTLLYREIVRGFKNATADDLLIAYRSLFYELARKNLIAGKLRMVEIVNGIWNGEKNGEVGYAWITWEAGLGVLSSQAAKYKMSELD